MTPAKVLYFSGEIPQGDPEGDQQELFRKLHLLSKDRAYPILASFLEAVTCAVKDERGRMTRVEKQLIPSFESVLDLTEHVVELRKTPFGAAVERVLVLVFQLGSFLAYHEANPLEYDFQESNTFLIGRGPGLLSAAAIGLSPRISMIPRIAEEITRVAFRFGLVVDQVCRSLEVTPDEINAGGAWICCAHGVDEESARQEVHRFNVENAYPETNQASVFNADGKSISISGPPSTLKTLFAESAFFRGSRVVPMKKVQGMWHTGRVYGAEHVEQIVPEMVNTIHELHLPLFSSSGTPLQCKKPSEVLEQIMEEMLTQSVHWDQTLHNVTNRLRELAPQSIQLVVVQPSHYVDSMLDHWRASIPSAEDSLSSQDMMSAAMSLLPTGPSRDTRCSKLAVVGMACRFPGGADDLDKFWEILSQGRDMHTPIPADRFNVATHVDPAGKVPNTSKTPFGCFVDNPGLFDALFFGMSPREAEQTDPMHRLALVTAYEALENAGYVRGRGSVHPRRVGTFYGQASDDYREVNSGQEIKAYFISGGCRAFAPGRINFFFDFWGPSFSVDTACSSSLAAIQAACTSLWSGDVDMALAGGLNIITNSDVYAGLSSGHFLSPTGNCKTWDEGADGYCRADGVGTVVIKRLEDAEADNDNILGVVLSAATDHSAEAVSITHPHDAAQAFLYKQVVRRAGIDPLAVGYVEMHGTGTQAGDTNEMRSVTEVFAPPGTRRRPIPLHIGAVKSNMGHGEAAAGIMGFIKTLLVLQKGSIPPHIGIKTRLNPALPQDLAKRGVVIPYQGAEWKQQTGRTRLAMVNNFGAAGGNTSIIMQEAPQVRPRSVQEDIRPLKNITVSGKTAFSLSANIQRLIDYAQSHPEVSVGDMAYTLTARRNHYSYRVSVVTSTQKDMVNLLQPHMEASLHQQPTPPKQPPVAFAFTGQGTFYLGIASQLYRNSTFFRRHANQLDYLAQSQGFPSFLPIITNSCSVDDVSTTTMHLAIVSAEIALARLWISYGVRPSCVIGHSLGEYAALAIAGVLSDSAVIFLVGTRAGLLDEACTARTHGMLSVRASVSAVRDVAEREGIPFEVSCINGPNETVVGGKVEDLKTLGAVLKEAGHRALFLDSIPHAYHTSQMDSLLEQFVIRCRAIEFKTPTVPILSPHSATIIHAGDAIGIDYLAASTRKTVNFSGALQNAWDLAVVSEATVWVEIGHHPTCTGFVSRTLPATKLTVASLHKDKEDWATMATSLGALYEIGVDIDWNEYHRPFEPALRLVSDLPTYAWKNSNYWIDYRGEWNLTKGRLEYGTSASQNQPNYSSSIHRVISEEYGENTAMVSAETSITDPALQAVVDGHAMNGYGVASSFLHADMAYTLAKYVYDKRRPGKDYNFNVSDFEYHEPVVKQRDTSTPQLLLITADADFSKNEVHIKWYNPAKELWYAHATVLCSQDAADSWLADWSRHNKLVSSRIAQLNGMAASGMANKVTTDLAYSLFGKLVAYSELYRTMQWAVLHEDEAVTEVVYPEDTNGTWTVPPHFIDGPVSLSGFILNGGTYFDNEKNFYITPSWKSMRFAKPLLPGGRYLAYVAMLPGGDGHSFVGDVYILQDGEIVGLVEAIKFLQWPRIMLNRFFSQPESSTATTTSAFKALSPSKSVGNPGLSTGSYSPVSDSSSSEGSSPTPPAKPEPGESEEMLDITARALNLVAQELAVDIGMLTDVVEIADLGLDSLMSLVLAARLREELGIEMRDAFFLEVNTVGDLKKLLK